MRFPRALSLAALCTLAPRLAVADTTTAGVVVDAVTGAPVEVGWVGLVTRATLDATPADQQVVFDVLVALDTTGTYAFTLDEGAPETDEFYLCALGPTHFAEIHGDVPATFAFPLRSDFDAAGVVALDDGTDHEIDFALDSNLETSLVVMRDGVTTLVTDVYRASPTAQAPTILIRSPYDRARLASSASYCVHGYNLVAQSVRGREGSGGTDAVFRADGWGTEQDGYDTIDWIVAQPFATDRVGMMGDSALGIAQYLAAGALHPSLTCCFATVGTGDLYEDLFFPGGVFQRALVEGWLAGQGSSSFLADLQDHPNQDAWWDPVDLSQRAGLVDVPFLHQAGWFDIFQAGATRSFRQLQDGGAPQKLVIGPWSHLHLYERSQGQLTYPVNATEHDDDFGNELRFFEYWLKGIDNGYYDSPAVRYYVMGDVDDPTAPGNEWRTADQWPPASSVVRSFWMVEDGVLTTDPRTRAALDAPLNRYVQYLFDPSDPAPTLGGNNFLLPPGPFDQGPVEARDDVVAFTTEVLEAPVEVTGDVRARLLVSSDRRDTDFMVKLCDVYPDGRSMLVTEGALHARHHLGHDSEHLLFPGQPTWMDVDMWGTSIVFQTGHRIRVTITSSNAPRWEVNPNTGQAFRKHTTSLVATNRIHCAPGYWSRIELPVVE